MKKNKFFLVALAATLVGCSSDNLVSDAPEKNSNTPIEFNVQKQNITRATNLEAVKHYNFGVWAWKVAGKNSLADAEVMNNYLVGWSNGSNLGYDKTNATTYATTAGTTSDHTSPWFYEKLGTAEYTYNGTAGFYKSSDGDYTSNNTHQYLRYWDLSYANTNFYCYAPYNKNVTFVKKSDNSVMTFPATTSIRDGYDEPQNSAYAAYSRTLGEYMYAGVRAKNSDLADVTIPFKHMGAQLFIRFYEDIPGYKVEIIDLGADNGTMASAASTDMARGIQATPAVLAGTTYSNGSYYTTSGATVTFAETTAAATYAPKWDGATLKDNTAPLMFKIPQAGLTTAADAPANLTDYAGLNSTTHKTIKEVVTSGTQEYSYSPTIYYPVAQPTTSKSGLTFHVSYRIIAEDNKEVITVHNATVHVPYTGTVTGNDPSISDGKALITVWQPNVKYTYTFKFTRGTTGTTNPDTTIDPTNPEASTKKSLFPIVFDAATIEDYTTNVSEYEVTNNTSY